MGKRSFHCDRRGATAVVFATSLVPMLAMAGLAIDVGNIFSAKRQLQATTDLAAIAAATDVYHANAAAAANAVTNGYLGSEVSDVELGTYTPDPTIPSGQRFQPGSTTAPNAVRVTMLHQQPLFFGRVFALAGHSNIVKNTQAISTQAVAAIRDTAAYSIGSRVASLSGGIENAVLGALVGGNVSLSAVDYNNLAAANVDLFALGKAIAVQAEQVGGTYKQAFSATIPLSTYLAALQSVAPSAADALTGLREAAPSGGGVVNLSKLLSFGPYSNLSLSDPEPNASATVSAMTLVQAAAEVGGPSHLVNLSFGATVPGIASVTGYMSLGEPAQGTTVITVDGVGSSLHTAQFRLYLDFSLVGTAALPLVQLPLYVEVGYGTAALSSLSCQPLDASTTSATLNVTPGLVNGWIGNVTAAEITNYTTEPTVTPATFINLGLVSVTGQAKAEVGNQQAVPITFSYSDIQNRVIKTTDTTDFAGSLLNSLLVKTVFQVNGIALPGLPTSVAVILGSAAGSVDQVLSQVLQTAGIGVGEADTSVSGAHCGAAQLSG